MAATAIVMIMATDSDGEKKWTAQDTATIVGLVVMGVLLVPMIVLLAHYCRYRECKKARKTRGMTAKTSRNWYGQRYISPVC